MANIFRNSGDYGLRQSYSIIEKKGDNLINTISVSDHHMFQKRGGVRGQWPTHRCTSLLDKIKQKQTSKTFLGLRPRPAPIDTLTKNRPVRVNTTGNGVGSKRGCTTSIYRLKVKTYLQGGNVNENILKTREFFPPIKIGGGPSVGGRKNRKGQGCGIGPKNKESPHLPLTDTFDSERGHLTSKGASTTPQRNTPGLVRTSRGYPYSMESCAP